MEKIPLIVLAGPTASGKSALAVEICKKYDMEIVTADSMQVYKHMNIGTAKPCKEEMQGIKHHMIDLVEPYEEYSLKDYVNDATKVINEIYSKGKIPLLTGGTGLYIDTLINNISLSETKKDEKLREDLEKYAKENGNDALHLMLKELDEESYNTIHPNNVKRVIRAIEFFKTTGIKQSEHIKASKQASPYNALKFCISFDRAVLYERINLRVDKMIDMGLVDEVEKIKAMGVTYENTSMQGIGYKEIMCYLDGNTSLSDAIDTIKMSTRRYAKRQNTWFKRWYDGYFVEPDLRNIDEILQKVWKNIL